MLSQSRLKKVKLELTNNEPTMKHLYCGSNLSHKKFPGCLDYIGGYTIRIPINEPAYWKVGGFFLWLTQHDEHMLLASANNQPLLYYLHKTTKKLPTPGDQAKTSSHRYKRSFGSKHPLTKISEHRDFIKQTDCNNKDNKN